MYCKWLDKGYGWWELVDKGFEWWLRKWQWKSFRYEGGFVRLVDFLRVRFWELWDGGEGEKVCWRVLEDGGSEIDGEGIMSVVGMEKQPGKKDLMTAEKRAMIWREKHHISWEEEIFVLDII